MVESSDSTFLGYNINISRVPLQRTLSPYVVARCSRARSPSSCLSCSSIGGASTSWVAAGTTSADAAARLASAAGGCCRPGSGAPPKAREAAAWHCTARLRGCGGAADACKQLLRPPSGRGGLRSDKEAEFGVVPAAVFCWTSGAIAPDRSQKRQNSRWGLRLGGQRGCVVFCQLLLRRRG